MNEGLRSLWANQKCITSNCKGWINVIVGSCCCNAVSSKVCDVGFAVKVVVLCYGLWKTSGFSQVRGCIQCLWVWSLSFAVLQVGVEHGYTFCAYTKLTFDLHHARHNCSVFIALWSGCSVTKITFYLDQTLWLWLVRSNSPVFTPPRYRPVGTQNARTPLYPKYYGHASSPWIPGLYQNYISKVLTVLKCRIITTLNRILLEKQRVQNRFAFYEVHIGHFFLQCQCCCQFWKSFNPVYIQILKIFTGRTDRKNRLLNPFAHARAG